VRVPIENHGGRAIPAPLTCSLEVGTLALRLYDPEEHTSYHFLPDGCPGGTGYQRILLEPGKTHQVSLFMVRLPRLDRVNYRFWNPKLWKPSNFYLVADCGGVRGYSQKIRIAARPEKELAKLLEYYGEEVAPGELPDWPIDRPSLHTFSLLSFPLNSAKPEYLAALEELLSPGSLRDLVHVTRLSQEVYDAKDVGEKRKATNKLLQWLRRQPETKRDWIASSLVRWVHTTNYRAFGAYSFDVLDELIPLLPKDFQETTRKENNERRQRYLEYLREQDATGK